jgi:hypothetical protein
VTSAAGQGVVTTVPGGVIQDGGMIDPQRTNRVATTAGTLITHMPFEPGAGALLSGPPLDAKTLFTPQAAAIHTSAPASILVGGNAEKEQALGVRRSAYQPLRARSGSTLGGYHAVSGSVGEFRGDTFNNTLRILGLVTGPPGFEASTGPRTGAPTLLPHGQRVPNSSLGAGAEMMPATGGGNGGTSSPTISAPVEGRSASPGGGHH